MRYPRAVLALLTSIVLVVACGGGETKPSSTSTPSGTATALPSASTTEPTPTTPGVPANYSNPLFHLAFSYPENWVPDPTYGDVGVDGIYEAYKDPRGRDYGFFFTMAIASEVYDLDQVAAVDAHHQLKPYGEHPVIEPATVDGRPARLILQDPSAPGGEPYTEELILAYDSPIRINDPPPYNLLVIWAHKDYIRAIAETVHLLSPAIPEPSP